MDTFPAGRQQHILALLQQRGVVHINNLAELCGVSAATIRRDLDELATQGKVNRTHGGAVLKTSTAFEPTNEQKRELMVAEKNRIASAAAKLVKDGDSLFLDSGTTVFRLAEYLTGYKNLTVVTNNTEISQMIEFDPSTNVVVTGGIKRQNYNVLVGSIAENFIRNINVDKSFIGVDAINVKKGIYNSNIEEVGIKQAAVACGDEAIIVTDSSKFSTSAIIKAYDFDDIDRIVTDSNISDSDRAELEKKSLELTIV